jgi:hypothetical protein
LQEDLDAELVVQLPDGFARLLVHGLAQYHRLLSATRVMNGAKCVVVSRRSTAAAQQWSQQWQQQARGELPQVASGSASVMVKDRTSFTGTAGADGVQEGATGRTKLAAPLSAAVATDSWHDVGLWSQCEISCFDVVMALHELGSEFDQHSLGRYLDVHGGISGIDEEGYVMV